MNTVIKSKIRILNILILFFGIGLFFAISYFHIIEGLKEKNILNMGTFLGVFFVISGLICIITLMKIQKLEIEEERVTVKNVFGSIRRVVYINQIDSYLEILGTRPHRYHKELILFTKTSKIKFTNSEISNYKEMKQILIKGKKKNYDYVK